jgi:hypothetical protein
MWIRSDFVRLVAYNTTIKTEFKMNIIRVRLIILNGFILWKINYMVIWQLDDDVPVDDVDTLHVKRMDKYHMSEINHFKVFVLWKIIWQM